MWRRVIVLPLCVCLLAAGSAQAAENQVLSVRASETERLRDLLSGKRINASFLDGNRLQSRVKEVQAGLLRVNIKKTSDPNSLPRGLQDIPTDRISTVQFTRYEGNKRALFGTVFSLGGVGLGGGVATATRGDRRRRRLFDGCDYRHRDWDTRLPVEKKERQEERHLDDPTTRTDWEEV